MPPQIIGLVAAILTTGSFLPQVLRVIKTRSTHDISLGMFVGACTGISLWLVYGIIIKDAPLIFANAISLVLASIVLVYKLKFK